MNNGTEVIRSPGFQYLTEKKLDNVLFKRDLYVEKNDIISR